MLIALDYDDTFTRHPSLWVEFIRTARSSGHEVMCVTMRHESEGEQVNRQLFGKVNRIIFTGRKAKKRTMEFLGLKVDVWIDDCPHFILTDAKDSNETL